MKITTPLQYIYLGGTIGYLSARKMGDRIFVKHHIYDNIKSLEKNLDDLGFAVSKNLFRVEFAPLLEEFEQLRTTDVDESSILVLSDAQATKLQNITLNLEKTVVAESQTLTIATPIPRRFELSHLLKHPEKILGRGVFDMLTPISKNDILYACRCVAFECSTAAAFHMLRATEECVRILYKCYFPRGNEKRVWGKLTTELKNKPRNPKPDIDLLTHLDHLRDRFRNPTDHPEKDYDIEEAEDLVHMSVDIVNRCMRDSIVIKKLSS